MEELLVLRVSLQDNNYKKHPAIGNTDVEVSFWYWIECNDKYEDAMKKFQQNLKIPNDTNKK